MNVEQTNPLKLISELLAANGFGENLYVGHIEYDKSVNNNYDYQIIETSTHDGTFLFTLMTIDKALLPLVNKASYDAALSKEKLNSLKDINYIIGDVILTKEYDDSIRSRSIRKQTDTVYIPVKCNYVFK